MARPHKPTVLKILHGDFKKNPQRRNTREPVVGSAIPACPKTLHGEARYEWKRITAELASIKVITKVDRAAIHEYCDLWASRRKCQKIVETDGQFYATETGLLEHPAAKAESRYADQIQRYLIQFGLTPAARARVNVTQPSEPQRMRRQR